MKETRSSLQKPVPFIPTGSALEFKEKENEGEMENIGSPGKEPSRR